MSDFDYGREKGLWGNDGLPYWVNSRESSDNYSVKESTHSNKQYNRSEQRALRNGFKEVLDGNAYNGRYFIKDNKKWIHNLKGLKSTLNVSSEYQLKQMGYDVDAYNKHNT